MISGVYQLEFENGSLYVGKSVDIPRRWEEHRKRLTSNKAATKLQYAYSRYGAPIPSVLVECHSDHIDIVEAYFIAKLRPSLNCAAPVSITQREYDIIDDSLVGAGLNLSTCEHLTLLNSLETKLNRHQDIITLLQNEIVVLKEEQSDAMLDRLGREYVAQLDTEYLSLEQEFHAYKALPWYKKIWK